MDGRCLHVRLLGGFLLVDEDTPVTTLHAPRLQALLAYLILKRDMPQSRQHIAFSLWPGSTEAQAQTNLRNILHQLHRVQPRTDDYLARNGRTLQWRGDALHTVDVDEFEQAIAQAEQHLRQRDRVGAQASLEEAVAHYRGELLPDCYDEWILPERERLRQLLTIALTRLVALMEEQRNYEAATTYAQQLLKTEPLHEAAYLQLMRLQALSGNRTAAMHTYHACASLLQREFGTEPGQPLRTAYAQLLAPRLVHRIPANLLRLVGREQEWIQLLHCWQSATAGLTQFVVLLGEAGIGKTRLAEEMLRWAEQQGISTAHTHCYPGEGDLIYAPVIGWLRSPTIQAVLSTLSPVWLTEISRLLPELRIVRPDIPPCDSLTDPWQCQHLFEALRQVVLAVRLPLLLCIDDLHWCDSASLVWLRYLLHDDVPAQVLVLATLRPEEIPTEHPLVDLLTSLGARGQATTIELDALTVTETIELATQVAGHVLSPEEGETLYAETEGNPLFIVETIRSGCDIQRVRTAGAADDMYVTRDAIVPTRIQAVVTSRLAKLSSLARDLAGVAATIGRSFSFVLLRRVYGTFDEETLVRGLEELRQHRIIREYAPGTYDFSHNKVREVTYAQLCLTRRRMLHCRIADALEDLHGCQPGWNNAWQAAHYEQAACPEQAIHAYQRAAEAAQRVYAPVEAAGYYQRAITLLETGLDDLPVVDHRLVGAIWLFYNDLKQAEAYLQATLALAERTGNVRIQAHCLGTLGLLCRKRQDIEPCRHYAHRTLAIATTYQFGDCLGMAHADLAWIAWREDNLDQVMEHGREALNQWRQCPIVYPFQWTARWPLVAAACTQHQIATAIEDAQPLLHLLQQQLPEPLQNAITEAVSAFDRDRLSDARDHLQHALDLARYLGFL